MTRPLSLNQFYIISKPFTILYVQYYCKQEAYAVLEITLQYNLFFNYKTNSWLAHNF